MGVTRQPMNSGRSHRRKPPRKALWVKIAQVGSIGAWIGPKKRIRARTSKRAKEERQYRKRSREWLRGKMCAVFPKLPATQVHHTHGRAGRLLLYEPWWAAVSSIGHHWIGSHVEQARSMGLICPVGSWNTPP